LEVSASFQALKSYIIRGGSAHQQTLVGDRLSIAINRGFAGAACEVVAVLAAHYELFIAGEDLNCRSYPFSDKAVAAIVNCPALALAGILSPIFGLLISPVRRPRAIDPVGWWTAAFSLFLMIDVEKVLCEDALLGISLDVECMLGPFGRPVAFVFEGSLEQLAYTVLADDVVVDVGQIFMRRVFQTNTAAG
jgi:hypothetical protein